MLFRPTTMKDASSGGGGIEAACVPDFAFSRLAFLLLLPLDGAT